MITIDDTQQEQTAGAALAAFDALLSGYLRRVLAEWSEGRPERTQRAFADRLGLSESEVSKLLNDRLAWQRRHLGHVATGLGLSVARLAAEASADDDTSGGEA